MSFPYRMDEEELRASIEMEVKEEIRLTMTENAARMVSVNNEGNVISLRLHRVFLEANSEVIKEVARFVRKRRGATPLISRFLREKSLAIGEGLREKKAAKAVTEGKYYDLKEIFSSVNEEYFGGSIGSSITWGSRAKKGRVRTRTLGSYCYITNSIRINPLLDNSRVPGYFIRFIVYHEMLHAHLGEGASVGRRQVHSKEFRRLEKMFKEYDKAAGWRLGGKVD